MNRWRKPIVAAVQLLLLGVSAALVVRIIVTADLHRVAALVSQSGAAILWILAPYLIAVSIDTTGWSILLTGLGHRIPHRLLLRLRLSTEAVLLSAPFGTAFAESLKAYLLERRFAVPVGDAVVSIGAKKTLLTIALGLYLMTSALVGGSELTRASQALLGRSGLQAAILTTGAIVLGIALLVLATLRGGRLATRLYQLLGALPIAAVRRFAATRRHGFTDMDDKLRSLAGDAKRLVGVTGIFYVGWLVEAAESYLVLRILGASVSFLDVVAVEATVALIRNVAVFAPAGLGVQDASYLAFYAATGIADPSTGTAFLVLKRAKELFWILTGYLLLVAHRNPASPAAVRGPKPKVLFVCGTPGQTQHMVEVREALGAQVEARFTPYYCDGLLRVLRAVGLLEVTAAGRKMTARCRRYLEDNALPVDDRGREGNYQLVVTCSDIVAQENLRGVPLVVAKDAMTARALADSCRHVLAAPAPAPSPALTLIAREEVRA